MYSVERTREVLSRTGDRYVDVEGWSEINGLSEDEAKEQLALGVRLGHFDQCFLYEWDDAPIPFVVPASYLGRTLRMHELGYIGEDDETEIEVSPARVREVFVARQDSLA